MECAVLPVGQSGPRGVAAPVLSSPPAMPESPTCMHVYVQYELAAQNSWLVTLLDSTQRQYVPSVATSGASNVRRAGQGKPVLICILAPSLCLTP